MKKKFRIEDLDCAHCASMVEKEIKKIDGVIYAEVNFLAQKLILEAEDERFDEVLEAARKAAKKVEPDCSII